MSNNDFAQFPHTPTITVKPFRAHADQAVLDDLKRRLEDAPTPRKTYENTTFKGQLGITREWLLKATEHWKSFDWRKVEHDINSFPNFTAQLTHLDHEFDFHFVGLFSKRADAVPLVMSHGWPGNFLEFIPALHHLTKTYTPDTLPVHLIVPSLIGFGYSSPPPIDVSFATRDNAPLIDQLMRGLGFKSYVAQGGDIGSFVSRYLGRDFDACRAIHLNFCADRPLDTLDQSKLDDFDKQCMEKCADWDAYERAYAMEHATKHATIAAVLESSPVALLAWLGEKLVVWTDETPPLDTILSIITLYWITGTFPTSIYHYRVAYGRNVDDRDQAAMVTNKPVGYSQFPHEILPIPAALVKARHNVTWSARHDKGGHFAALEQPVVLWNDVLDFIGSLQ